MKKIALITGVSGQDGAYLAELLLKKKYKVIGTKRASTNRNLWRLRKLNIQDKIIIERMDITNDKDIKKIFNKYNISEVYNLAAQSFVKNSFTDPISTANISGIGVLRILEIIRSKNKKIKFYQASSSEMYGNSNSKSQSEKTWFNPQSPYAISKLFGHYITRNYRISYNLFAVSGILFNHESPLRGDDFVTKKIIKGLVNYKFKNRKYLELGNIHTKRDWGYSKEYVEQMWKMMQLKVANDFVIATGKSYSIKQLIDVASQYLNINTKWVGKDLNLKIINKDNNKTIIKINKNLFRPSEIKVVKGNIKKAKKYLKWKPKISFKALIKLMIDDELANIKIPKN